MDAGSLAERIETPAPAKGPAAWLAVRMPRTRALRWRTALAVVIVAPMALGTSFAFLLMVTRAPTLAGQLFGAIVGAACSAATAWWLGTRLEMACTSGRLTVEHDRLRIEDRGLLRDPIIVHRSQLRGAAMGSPDPDLGWVPALVDPYATRNLTLLFSEPLPAPRLRRRGDRLPPRGAALTALALHVDEPDAVAAALRDWDALRPLGADDGALHLASEHHGPLRRAIVSRSERRGWLLVACGVIVPPVALVALLDATVLLDTRPRRAYALALAALTVCAGRVGLALALGYGSATCGV
ncbi:MAG: hypothetical protein Q8K79_15490 [Solirubrobacteraceae bacterium]|nr:hypothetical protein [Solirubrobacteraceae bacterium]